MIAEDLIKEILSFYRDGSGCIIVFCLDEVPYINTLMTKYFPTIMYNCQRMYLKTEIFKEDFQRNCVYAFSGYERG